MRKFEKISLAQYQKDVNRNEVEWKTFSLPSRTTKHSAGYDFIALSDFEILPGEMKKIPTGVKVQMEEDEVLLLMIRSSMGFRYNIRMCNQVGVIDSDYYNNIDNEGHIWIKLQNEGTEVYRVQKGDKIVQGIFIKFLLVDNEEETLKNRIGGLGSTN